MQESIEELQKRLGANLRAARKQQYPHDSQATFCRRIAVSRQTYQKMEKGDPSVGMGHYLRAAALLDIGDQLVAGFAPPRLSIFDPRARRQR